MAPTLLFRHLVSVVFIVNPEGDFHPKQDNSLTYKILSGIWASLIIVYMPDKPIYFGRHKAFRMIQMDADI
jgi:hypothetical protein